MLKFIQNLKFILNLKYMVLNPYLTTCLIILTTVLITLYSDMVYCLDEGFNSQEPSSSSSSSSTGSQNSSGNKWDDFMDTRIRYETTPRQIKSFLINTSLIPLGAYVMYYAMKGGAWTSEHFGGTVFTKGILVLSGATVFGTYSLMSQAIIRKSVSGSEGFRTVTVLPKEVNATEVNAKEVLKETVLSPVPIADNTKEAFRRALETLPPKTAVIPQSTTTPTVTQATTQATTQTTAQVAQTTVQVTPPVTAPLKDEYIINSPFEPNQLFTNLFTNLDPWADNPDIAILSCGVVFILTALQCLNFIVIRYTLIKYSPSIINHLRSYPRMITKFEGLLTLLNKSFKLYIIGFTVLIYLALLGALIAMLILLN